MIPSKERRMLVKNRSAMIHTVLWVAYTLGLVGALICGILLAHS